MSSKRYNTYRLYESTNPEAGYNSLAYAIVMQAVIDYDISMRRMLDKKFTKTYTYNERNCIYYVQDTKRFFKSNYFGLLSDINGNLVLDKVNERIKKDYGIADDRELYV